MLVTLSKMKSAFERAHKAQFGFIDRAKALVIEAVSVEAIGGGATFREKTRKATRAKLPPPARRTRFFSNGKWQRALVYTRDTLAPGHKVKGPAIIIEPHQTVVVEHGWQAELTAKDHLVLRRVQKLKRTRAIGTHADPVMLEVFNNLFMSIAEQMGVALQNTAYSVNIKERLDFSCAVFAGDASLVANAPHMPVHLGSMDRAVETVIRAWTEIGESLAAVANDGRNRTESFDVTEQRGRRPCARDRRKRGLHTRNAALPLKRLHERRLFAYLVRARA